MDFIKWTITICLIGCLTLARADLFEYDGSGDLKSAGMSTLPKKSRGIVLTTSDIRPDDAQLKRKIKRTMYSLFPGLIVRYLDANLGKRVREETRELVTSMKEKDDMIGEQNKRMKKMEGRILRLEGRLRGLGERMDTVEETLKNRPEQKEQKAESETSEKKMLLETIRKKKKKKNKKRKKEQKQKDVNVDKFHRLNTALTQENTTCKPYQKKNGLRISKSLPTMIFDAKPKVLSISNRDSQFFLFSETQKGEFPLKSRKVRAMVYDDTSGNIIWSNYTSGSYGIFSLSLERPRRVTRLSRISAEGLAVDKCKRWVFFTTITPRRTISKMTVKGRHYKKIKDLRTYSPYVFSLAVDPDRRLIYTCHHSNLMETSYDGHHHRLIVTKASSIFAVTLDLTNRVLYYGAWGQIKGIWLDEDHEQTIARVSAAPRNLVFYKGKLYCDKGTNIQVVNAFDGEIKTIGNLTDTTLSIALIP